MKRRRHTPDQVLRQGCDAKWLLGDGTMIPEAATSLGSASRPPLARWPQTSRAGWRPTSRSGSKSSSNATRGSRRIVADQALKDRRAGGGPERKPLRPARRRRSKRRPLERSCTNRGCRRGPLRLLADPSCCDAPGFLRQAEREVTIGCGRAQKRSVYSIALTLNHPGDRPPTWPKSRPGCVMLERIAGPGLAPQPQPNRTEDARV